MAIEVKVPVLPESVADATIAAWHKKVGDAVKRGENLVDLETDKVVLEVPAPEDGVVEAIHATAGETVQAKQLLLTLNTSASGKQETSSKSEEKAEKPAASKSASVSDEGVASPSVRRMMAEHNIETTAVSGSGKGGRITKEDVESMIMTSRKEQLTPSKTAPEMTASSGSREEKRVPMTRMRAKIAERLLEAQHNAAMLTTFNEVNLHKVMQMRAEYKDIFEKKHGVKLGLMSLFTKAVIEGLKRFPSVNASVDGQDIVYHGYYDIGVAVSTERGLVVPVIRDADKMSLAEIELAIGAMANKARTGKLALEDMQGGTFTITNGGVFGSLLATPIINPPQTGILGMHKIEDRPIVEKGEIVIRPMMYVALSYDHRLIDGRESVQFLVTVKEMLEDPARLLLNV